MQYAGYYNLVQADKAARLAESRRASSNTTTSTEQKPKKSTFKKILNQLRATETEITPSGIYSPIIKQGPLFHQVRVSEENAAPSGIYSPIIKQGPLFHSKKNASRSSVSSTSSSENQIKA